MKYFNYFFTNHYSNWEFNMTIFDYLNAFFIINLNLFFNFFKNLNLLNSFKCCLIINSSLPQSFINYKNHFNPDYLKFLKIIITNLCIKFGIN